MMSPIFREEVYTDEELIEFIRAHNDESFRYLYLKSVEQAKTLQGDAFRDWLKNGLIRLWDRRRTGALKSEHVLEQFQQLLTEKVAPIALQEARQLELLFRQMEDTEQLILIYEYYDRRGIENTASLIYTSVDEIRQHKLELVAKWSGIAEEQYKGFTQHFPNLKAFEKVEAEWYAAGELANGGSEALQFLGNLLRKVQLVGLIRSLDKVGDQIDDHLKAPTQPKFSIPFFVGALMLVLVIIFSLRLFLPPQHEVLTRRYITPFPPVNVSGYSAEAQAAMKWYKKKDYTKALEAFAASPAMVDTSELLTFYKIQSLMKTGEYRLAKAEWAKFSSGESQRQHTKDWHLALIDLQEGKIEQARMQFKAMENNEQHYYKRLATTLLKKTQAL